MAVGNRQPPWGLVLHSDRGSQYSSEDYRAALSANGMVANVNRRACCYDNAAMESFWHMLKVELIHRQRFQTRAEYIKAIFEYMEVFYNRTRIHSSIGHVSPVDFEPQHSAVAYLPVHGIGEDQITLDEIAHFQKIDLIEVLTALAVWVR